MLERGQERTGTTNQRDRSSIFHKVEQGAGAQHVIFCGHGRSGRVRRRHGLRAAEVGHSIHDPILGATHRTAESSCDDVPAIRLLSRGNEPCIFVGRGAAEYVDQFSKHCTQL